MNYEELERLVIQWGADKGILEKATPLAQANKTQEEVDELMLAIINQSAGFKTFSNKKGEKVSTEAEIKDAFGDILVTIILGSRLQGLNLIDCLKSAYNVISKRTGKMIDGQFVKDE